MKIYNSMTLDQLIKALDYQRKRAEAWKQEAINRGWAGFPLKKVAVLVFALLTLVGSASASSVNLTWSEPSTSVPFGFNIYRIVVASGTTCPTFATTTWTQIVGSLPGTQLSASDSTIATNKLYCYAVTAYATDGSQAETAPSNLLFMSTAVAPAKLPSPTGLAGTFVQ